MHKVLVVGGGAGGLELVTKLGKIKSLFGGSKPKAKVTLLDGSSTHIWKPLLHEVATGALNTGEDELNYFSHARASNYEFKFGYMNNLDLQKKVVKAAPVTVAHQNVCGPREFPFDTLILAVGAIPDTFGTKGAKKHCLFLNTPEQANYIRLRILVGVLSVIIRSSPVSVLRIGIVGAGATGTELAAEIHHTMTSLIGYGLGADQLEMTIIEAAPRILAGGSESLSKYATNELLNRGIDIRTNCSIKSVNEKGFVLSDGTQLDKEIRIWTAGIKGPDWLKTIGLEVNKVNRVKVNRNLQSLTHPDVFALGDCACVPLLSSLNEHKVCLPASAQIAHQEADWMVKYIKFRLGAGRNCGPFVYRPQGMLISLGDKSAVGSLPTHLGPPGSKGLQMEVHGRLVKGLYISLYRQHQAALYGWRRTGLIYLGDKLRHAAGPKLKLH